MKNLFVALIMIGCLPSVTAQNDKYVKGMEKSVLMLDTASKASTYQMLMNNFERIASVEKDKWLPYYYAGYCAAMLTYKERDLNMIDAKADKADLFIQSADALSPENSEVNCIKAMIAFSRINVDFMARGPKYSTLAHELLLNAQKIDPNNPRSYLLIGQSKYGTPEQFGGDKKLARKLFDKAVALYASPNQNFIEPHWGKKDAESLLAKCQQLASGSTQDSHK